MAEAVPIPAKSVTARALSVLGAFRAAEPELTLSQIARATGLPVATVFRLAAELEEGGFLQKGPGGRYCLGIRLWEMGLLTPVHGHLREMAMPVLLNLQYRTQETVQLAVCDGHDAVYIEKLSMDLNAPVQSRVGARIPLHATAVGQALLAAGSSDLIDQTCAGPLTPYTERTITSGRALRELLSRVRAQGFAHSSEEYLAGSTAIAAPVVVDGVLEAAIGVVNYQLRDDLERFVPELHEACAALAARIHEFNRRQAAS